MMTRQVHIKIEHWATLKVNWSVESLRARHLLLMGHVVCINDSALGSLCENGQRVSVSRLRFWLIDLITQTGTNNCSRRSLFSLKEFLIEKNRF